MVTEAINRYTNFRRANGLCNVPVNMKNPISRIFEVKPDQVELEIVGMVYLKLKILSIAMLVVTYRKNHQ